MRVASVVVCVHLMYYCLAIMRVASLGAGSTVTLHVVHVS
jgi:hypothetical protein